MRGMTLVELMVGVAVGLFVVAAAALMTSSQLTDNRRLLLETQLQQDLRAAADLVTRDLRRTGFWGNNAYKGIPRPIPAPTDTVINNPFASVLPTGGVPSPAQILYRYLRSSGSADFGFRLDANGVVQACQSDLTTGGCSAGWQDLTDGNTMKVDDFSVLAPSPNRATNTDLIRLPCPNLCPLAPPPGMDATYCWPTVGSQALSVRIKAEARTDAAVVRELVTGVHARNLNVVLSADVPVGQSCPAAP
jgi:type IV pilus assembly protein PilW